MTAWRKTSSYFEVYNVASEDWITINELADIVIETMGLKNVEKKYKPILHGVGWLGDVKKIALRIDKIKRQGFKPSMNSRETVKQTVMDILEEIESKA
jgi:UDP-glucose 4-epimerase